LKPDQYWAAIQSFKDSCGPITGRITTPVAESVAFPLNTRGSIMPHANISLDPSLTAIDRPPCTKCDGQMIFTGMVSGPPGFDIRTFECIACDFVETVATGKTMMAWINSEGLRPPR
jgi:hypothetical protein